MTPFAHITDYDERMALIAFHYAHWLAEDCCLALI